MNARDLPPADAAAPPCPAAMEQAAQWFALLQSGQASAADRQRWQDWLAANAEHRRAWAYAEAVGQDLAQLRASAHPPTLAEHLLSAQRRLARRRTLLGLALMAGSGSLGWALWRHTSLPQTVLAWQADERTATGQIRALTLPDGTRLWLNTASAVNLRYGPAERRVELLRGEVLIATAPDAAPAQAPARARPFVLDTPHGRLHALGTRFAARLLDDDAQTLASVSEGAVQLLAPGATPADATAVAPAPILRAGQQARLGPQGVQHIATADPLAQSWASGTLQAQGMALQALADELGRYWSGHISVHEAVAQRTVFGSFDVRDVPRSLHALQAALPVRVSQPLPWWIRIQPR
ncbi:FecR domain-containing protein [Vandammella animalimorsus]|uniref:Iron dicitrate transport regulator FecR n=1 Tax=Vandammella animalimorsus TaxID=2029117 RepID=A0A2A2A7C6_9BURK|nr:FecR domain-containing protein [Vandammella animalimorsus]PAT34420.1 iron dicitrate transport regulator FecR [Vandammella animalimorsus]